MRSRVDTANRSFLMFAGLVVAPYVLFFLVACGLVTIFTLRFADHGLGALTAGRGDLRPAAAVLLVLAAATALAVRSLRAQVRATRRLAERVRALAAPMPDTLAEAASRAGLAGRVDLLDTDEPFSFAYGLGRPRVAVSRGLLASTEPAELLAVLEHERYHVRHLDPFKVVVARSASAAYFFLPALRGLRRRYAAASELAADRRAMHACGRGALGGALYRSVRGPDWDELSTAAAIGGPDLLDVRVSQIESGEEPAVVPVSKEQAIVSAAVLLGIAGTLAFTVVSLGGPSAMMHEAMGSNASMDGDMDMGLAGWWWVAVLAVGAVVAWVVWRRRPST